MRDRGEPGKVSSDATLALHRQLERDGLDSAAVSAVAEKRTGMAERLPRGPTIA